MKNLVVFGGPRFEDIENEVWAKFRATLDFTPERELSIKEQILWKRAERKIRKEVGV